jgi:hypothetical protein
MGWLSKPRLAELLQRQESLLDEIFGKSVYQIEDSDEQFCVLRTEAVEIEFAYDWRDQWLASSIKPLNVPPAVAETNIIETWVRFQDKEVALRRKSQLDDRQVIDELKLVRQVMTDIFTDPQTARDAAYFAWGYTIAYNDWASGRGSWTEVD